MDTNDKERELYRIVDCVARCCAIRLPDGRMSITRDDILGPSRTENLVMSRCILIMQLLRAGYSATTAALLLGRTVAAIRHLNNVAHNYHASSRAFRIAYKETSLLCDGEKIANVEK